MNKWLLITLTTGIGLAGGIMADRMMHTPTPVNEAVSLNNTKKSLSTIKNDTNQTIIQAPKGGFDPTYVSSIPVNQALVPEIVPVSGKLAFDTEHLHLASSRVAGRLDRIFVFEGNKVSAGQPLAEIYSPDYISAENEYLLARNTVHTFQAGGDKELLNDAKATFDAAKNKLRVLGASEQEIASLDKTGVAASHLILRAPISGMIVKRNMDPGAFLNLGDSFMSIVNTSKLWFLGNIYEDDYSKVKIGQSLQMESAALPGKQFAGKISYITPSIDPTTHTLAIRCDVQNPEGILRPEIFVTSNLTVGMKHAVVVPKEAILDIKGASFVIIDRGNGTYERVAVSVEAYKEDMVAVLSGLFGTERIVTKGSTLVNEMLAK